MFKQKNPLFFFLHAKKKKKEARYDDDRKSFNFLLFQHIFK